MSERERKKEEEHKSRLLEICLSSGVSVTEDHGAFHQLDVLVRFVGHQAKQARGLLLHVILGHILELVQHDIQVNGGTITESDGATLMKKKHREPTH